MTYLTPALFKTNGLGLLAEIANNINGFSWVGLLPIAHVSPGMVQVICDLVNKATGAVPPAATPTVPPA